MKYDSIFFLRIGLAFVFLYSAISGFINPQLWLGYVPNFFGNFIARGYVLFAHDITNLIIGLWLISGKKTYWAAVLSALTSAALVQYSRAFTTGVRHKFNNELKKSLLEFMGIGEVRKKLQICSKIVFFKMPC